MATAEGIKAKLQGLIEAANAATGNADADLTAAVNSLISGAGGGGAVKSMTITPAEVVLTVTLPELIGKQNVILIPQFAPAADMASEGRISGLGVYINGKFLLGTRTNTGRTAWSSYNTTYPYENKNGVYFAFNPQTGEIGSAGSSTYGQLVCQEYEIIYW